jgi:hypothetical protein
MAIRRRGLDGRFISKEQSKSVPFTVKDSLGRTQRFFHGKRISEKLYTGIRTEAREQFIRPKIEPGQISDPGRVTQSGRYIYEGGGWIVSDGDTILSLKQIPGSELVPKNTRGAEHGSHIKLFPRKELESVTDVYDAAFQIAADPALKIDPKQVIVKSVRWSSSADAYIVDYMIDFSPAYKQKEG